MLFSSQSLLFSSQQSLLRFFQFILTIIFA